MNIYPVLFNPKKLMVCNYIKWKLCKAQENKFLPQETYNLNFDKVKNNPERGRINVKNQWSRETTGLCQKLHRKDEFCSDVRKFERWHHMGILEGSSPWKTDCNLGARTSSSSILEGVENPGLKKFVQISSSHVTGDDNPACWSWMILYYHCCWENTVLLNP